MISLILLSGGLNSRFGSPKALAPWGSKPLIAHLQNTLLATNIDEIVIVLGAFAEEIKPFLLKHNKIKVVYNKDYKLGQTSSFKVGLQAVSSSAKVFALLPVDFPLIKAVTVNSLIAHYHEIQPLILVPSYRGKKGHPPFFADSLRKEFFALENDAGLNTIAHHHVSDTHLCEVDDEGILLSFNTPSEIQKLREKII
ncbi:MAG: nucleotidyltransferase family protein [Candidatus Omnitrophica bacterium]|nr:nucleotidyltransferase family protein [Candidatus Omnitrophota bacterium]